MPAKHINDIDAEALIDALDMTMWYGKLDHIKNWANIKPDINGDIPKPKLSRDPTEEFLWTLCVLLFGEYNFYPKDGYITSDSKFAFRQFINEITKTIQENGRFNRFND